MITSKNRGLAACGAAVLGVGLIFGAGSAVAVEKPVVGTEDCTLAVNRNVDVKFADDQVTTARNNVAAALKATDTTPEELEALNTTLSRAQDQDRAVRGVVQGQLCQEGTAPTQTTTPKPSTPVETSPPVVTRTEVESRTVIPVPTVQRETVVIHTEDDGSTASTSGSQVSVVPEGSADTGAA